MGVAIDTAGSNQRKYTREEPKLPKHLRRLPRPTKIKMEVGTGFDSWEEFSTVFSSLIWSEKWKVLIWNDIIIKTDFSCSISIDKMVCTSLIWNISIQRSNEWLNLLMALIFSLMGIKNKHCHTIKYLCFLERISNFESHSVNRYFTDLAWRMV